MYIAPNSVVNILSNVTLKNDYKHTILFASRSAQNSYFSSKISYTFNNLSYAKPYEKKVRLEKSADDLYGANYVMFQNSSFGQKWWFAFITNIEYINNTTSEITYEIDVMQSFMFDTTINPCFVERQHAEFDDIGLNIVPEPVEVGEYVYSNRQDITALDDMAVILAILNDDPMSLGVEIGSYDHIFSGFDLWAFRSSDIEGIRLTLTLHQSSPDDIKGFYMVPSFLIGNIPIGGKQLITSGSTSFVTSKLNYTVIKPVGNEPFEQYTDVKNKKLYTYPYNFLLVSNNSGNSLNLRYEKFSSGGGFEVEGSILPPVKTIIRPTGYKGSSAASAQENLTLESYPECSWTGDSYSQWKAQNSVPIALNAASGAAQSALVGAFTGFNPVTMAASAIGSVSKLLSESYSASIAADQCRGNTNSSNINAMHSKQHFVIQRANIQRNYAESIDSFFTVYGYAQKRIMTPNRNARPQFTYIKTNGSNVTGNCPAEMLARINRAYDDGITFWNHPENMYNYNVDNSPYSD